MSQESGAAGLYIGCAVEVQFLCRRNQRCLFPKVRYQSWYLGPPGAAAAA